MEQEVFLQFEVNEFISNTSWLTLAWKIGWNWKTFFVFERLNRRLFEYLKRFHYFSRWFEVQIRFLHLSSWLWEMISISSSIKEEKMAQKELQLVRVLVFKKPWDSKERRDWLPLGSLWFGEEPEGFFTISLFIWDGLIFCLFVCLK